MTVSVAAGTFWLLDETYSQCGVDNDVEIVYGLNYSFYDAWIIWLNVGVDRVIEFLWVEDFNAV